MDKIRTRFPPSPTGPFHMGSARTALFNYLFAKKHGGKFILRIEDTDKERSSKEWETDIVENLKWLGLKHDEGPERQSERTAIYKAYLEKLFEQKKVYYCFCTEEELDAQRQEQMSRGEAPRYKGTCKNIEFQEAQKKIGEGKSAVIRFISEPKLISFHDIIRGEVKFDSALLGDFVIAKDLDNALYNFTVVVDDQKMNITHVIRGEDHISNTPKQILLQEALGFRQPQYAHLPLILAEDRSKLSKRHGDNSVTRFRNEGYLPEAIINFLVLLGWNPGDNREVFSLEELVKEFSLERVQKAGAIFNLKRLDWINGFYIRKLPIDKLAELCLPYLKNAEQEVPFQTLQEIAALHQERLKKLSEIAEVADFFFKKELQYPKSMLLWKQYTKEDTAKSLNTLEVTLSALEEKEWNREKLSEVLLQKAEEVGDKGYLLWPMRVALTGKQASAGPFEVAAILGKEKTLQRISKAKQLLDEP
ncbi:MAG: glutamate--tRNA ligase [Candidatus Wildermuthbacteria bacterium]|nr:glutamate--tRNA ligase [Candidatus Wildermuthbacteria bacterium]